MTAFGAFAAIIVLSACSSGPTAPSAGSGAVADLVVRPSSAVVQPGDTVQLSATPVDSNGRSVSDINITWASSDSSVATVDGSGVVTGVSAGTAVIRASGAGVEDSSVVTVESGTSGSGSSTPAELPRAEPQTAYSPPGGRVLQVAAGGDFQAALDSARPGDVVVLQAGAAYTGNFTLPVRGDTSTQWIVVRSSAMASLPPQGTRVGPGDAPNMAKIVTPNTMPAIRAPPGAHHYRLMGLEVTVEHTTSMSSLITWGSNGTDQTTPDQAPHHLILDRSYVHGNGTIALQRGLELNSAWSAVIDSYFSDIHAAGQDAQAIAGWNGPGPFLIQNNYLEASGENVMFGGANAQSDAMIPQDVTIRHNYFFKPMAWFTNDSYQVKNLLETKHVERILIEGNLFENNWVGADQAGYAIVFSLCCGGPDTDITFRYNRVTNSTRGFGFNRRVDITSRPLIRVSIHDNVIDRLGKESDFGTSGWGYEFGNGPDDVQIIHNTLISGTRFTSTAGHQIFFDPGTEGHLADGFIYRDNISRGPIDGSGTGDGDETLNHYTTSNRDVRNNVIAHPDKASAYGSIAGVSGNMFPATLADVGFTDLAGGDYTLLPTSPYAGTATDGTDPGADIAALDARIAGVRTGIMP